MHYGPNFRLCQAFGHTMPLDENHFKYAVLQLRGFHRDGDWEEVLCFHPPMYDCGLQAQMASQATMYALGSEAERGAWLLKSCWHCVLREATSHSLLSYICTR